MLDLHRYLLASMHTGLLLGVILPASRGGRTHRVPRQPELTYFKHLCRTISSAVWPHLRQRVSPSSSADLLSVQNVPVQNASKLLRKSLVV